MEMRSQDFDSVALFNKALEAHNAGDLTAAEQIYKETLAIQPDHCEANHNIGIVLVAKNELDKALEFFKLALTASPNVSLFWANYIDTLAKLERIIEAKALIKAAKNSGMSCENIEAISHRLATENQEPLAKDTREIDEFITQQKFDDAIEACLNLLETYPSSGILNITLGKCYFELGQIDLAISSCTKATEYWPQSEVSYAMLGQIYSSQGDTEHAIKNLRKAVELKPDDEGLNSLLMLELSQSGDFDAAIESLEQALKLKPDYAEAHFHLGNTLNKKGDRGAAIESYKRALQLKPDHACTYYNIGVALQGQGELDAAIDSYKQALKIKPDFAEAYYNMGNTLKDQGKLEGAIEAYWKALSLKPDYAEAYNNMGIALTRQDKLEEAIEAFSKALSLKSDFAEAYSNMGNTLKDQGKLEGAIKAYRKAIAIKPNLAEVYNNMSLVLLATQNFSQGFKLHEWRWKTKERDGTFLQSSKPLWNNEQGKSVFVWGEQGIGDEIMFAAMIPELHKLSSKIILRCDARLIPLFKRSFPGNIIYYSKGEAVAEDEYDFHIPIGSLANIFRTSLESFKQTSAGFLNYDREKTSS